jgi:hypothetical protein
MAITITSTVDRETRNPGSETSVLFGKPGSDTEQRSLLGTGDPAQGILAHSHGRKKPG